MPRLFANYKAGQPVLVSGVPGVIVGVTFRRGGEVITIRVNGSEGEYHPSDFQSIIVLVDTQEQVL